MAKLLVLFSFMLVCVVYQTFGLDLDCPSSSKMISCSPTCKSDIECSGRKCCPNVCNTRSCVPANFKDDGKGSYKENISKGGTGVYCGNTKCNSFEKCGMDSNKRPKCMRA